MSRALALALARALPLFIVGYSMPVPTTVVVVDDDDDSVGVLEVGLQTARFDVKTARERLA